MQIRISRRELIALAGAAAAATIMPDAPAEAASRPAVNVIGLVGDLKWIGPTVRFDLFRNGEPVGNPRFAPGTATVKPGIIEIRTPDVVWDDLPADTLIDYCQMSFPDAIPPFNKLKTGVSIPYAAPVPAGGTLTLQWS